MKLYNNWLIGAALICGAILNIYAGDKTMISEEQGKADQAAFETAAALPPAEQAKQPSFEELVTETHKASLKLREQTLRKTIAKDKAWPWNALGDAVWILSALYLNERVDEANARLLKQANDFIALSRTPDSAVMPDLLDSKIWWMFGTTEYVRILCLFHANSAHFPGRLKPEAEAALKEALWLWVSGFSRFADGAESRIADTGTQNLFLQLGTENHDLNRRPNYYLVTSLLKEDPAYRDRKLKDGHSVAEHADAHAAFFRELPASRARTGLWVELGAGYQKYSWPPLFNLHELAPDPVMRQRFKMLLDLAFIEEEQISVQGRRGGGRSRAGNGKSDFEPYKNLLFAPEGQPAGSSHSRVIETSRYQLPVEAILLRYRTFPVAEPFFIRNRVLGELETPDSENRLAADSALVNYAWRTPHYLLGGTLLNPALAMTDPKTGVPTNKYSPISRQKRACGMIFDGSAYDDICAVYPEVEKHGKGGRPSNSFWSVQHENVLILQRIAPAGRSSLGSYSTDAVGIGFEGKALKKVEEAGWIFASNSKAFVGVKFLDGGYVWDEKHALATPANFKKATDTSRILLHAGDIASHDSFEKFKTDVLGSRLSVAPEKVEYLFAGGKNRIEMNLYDAKTPEKFVLPRINGTPVDLRPEAVYDSPYLKGRFGSDKITVTVGPFITVYDFEKVEIRRSVARNP